MVSLIKKHRKGKAAAGLIVAAVCMYSHRAVEMADSQSPN